MTTPTFKSLGLCEKIDIALQAEGYDKPTPIQEKAIPLFLGGSDLLAIAQTGTGKTAAYCLPLLDRLALQNAPLKPNTAQAVVLVPTRELALQVEDSLKRYGKHLKMRYAVVIGGVSMKPQIAALAKGVHVVVATTGRLLDHVRAKTFTLGEVGFLVLDEADRMLDMGFINDVRQIVKSMPKSRQSALFSATMPADVAKLAAQILQNPEKLEITPPGTVAPRVTQQVLYVDRAKKLGALENMLRDTEMRRIIVFSRTKRGADRVSAYIQKGGVEAEAFHGNKSQNARQKTLERFANGKLRVLVATDIAARGIDIDNVSHVINFELPDDTENYIHRIGRTARAGADGIAISLCDPSERSTVRLIEKRTGQVLQEQSFAGQDAEHSRKEVSEQEPISSVRIERPRLKRKTKSTGNTRTDGASTKPERSKEQKAKSGISPKPSSPKRDRISSTRASDVTKPSGTIKWFNARKGFGFVSPDRGGQDVFLHITVAERAGLGTPQEGQKVHYEVEQDQRGRLSAISLKAA